MLMYATTTSQWTHTINYLIRSLSAAKQAQVKHQTDLFSVVYNLLAYVANLSWKILLFLAFEAK